MSEDIIIIIKDGCKLSDKEICYMHNTLTCQSDYLMIKGLTFEDNIIYLN